MLEKEPSKCKDLYDTHKQGLNDKTSGAHWCDPSTGKKKSGAAGSKSDRFGGLGRRKKLILGVWESWRMDSHFFYIECDLTQATSSSLLLL